MSEPFTQNSLSWHKGERMSLHNLLMVGCCTLWGIILPDHAKDVRVWQMHFPVI